MISFAGTCTEVDFGANSDLEGGHELPPPSSAGGSFVTAQSSNDDNNSSYLSPLNLLLELSRKGTGTETNPWAIDVEDRAETSFNWRSSALTPWLVNQELLPPSMRIEGIHPGVDLTAQDAPFFDSMSLTSLYSTLTNQSTSRSSGSSNPKRSEDPYDGEDEAEAGENRRNSISNSELFNKMESVERGILHVASMLEALPNKELTESRALTRKLVGLPKRRSPQENALKRKVREHFVAMLGGETALLHQDKRVSISEISAFEVSLKADRANCPPCCSADALRVDLHGQPRSEWNKSVARVSALDYIKSNPASGDNLSNIEKYILTYIKTLHAKVRRLDIQLSYADEEKTKSLERHRCRKANLYQQRMQTASTEPLLRPHIGILQLLGPDGVSSDESDGEPGALTVYRICILPWRATELTSFVRVFDAFAAILKRLRFPHLGSGIGRGALPRIRVAVEGLFSTNGRFVPGLPVNAYLTVWLSGIRTPELTVQPTSEPYNFAHDNRIFLLLGKK